MRQYVKAMVDLILNPCVFLFVFFMAQINILCAITLQIQKVVIALGDYMEAKCHACIGGTDVKENMLALEKGLHTVVGTPGRVYDMMSRRSLGRFNFHCRETGLRSYIGT